MKNPHEPHITHPDKAACLRMIEQFKELAAKDGKTIDAVEIRRFDEKHAFKSFVIQFLVSWNGEEKRKMIKLVFEGDEIPDAIKIDKAYKSLLMKNPHELPDGDYIVNGQWSVTKKNGVFRYSDGTSWLGDEFDRKITSCKPIQTHIEMSSDPALHEAYKGALAMLAATPENPTMTDVETILKENHARICFWKESENGQWYTSCKNMWEFDNDVIEESPSLNRMKYCPFCGKIIIEQRFVGE